MFLFAATVVYYGAARFNKQTGVALCLGGVVCVVLSAVGVFYFARGVRSCCLRITPVSLILYNTAYSASDIKWISRQKSSSFLLHVSAEKRPWWEKALHIKDGWFRTVVEAVASFFVILFCFPVKQQSVSVTFILALGYFALRHYFIFIREDLTSSSETPLIFPVPIPQPPQNQKEALHKALAFFSEANDIPFYQG